MAGKIKELILLLFNRYRNIILYAIIGGLSAGLDFLVYSLLCKSGLHFQVANVVSVHCGIFCSFILNRHYNFKVKDKTLLRFLSFYVIGLIGLALSASLLYVLVDVSSWNEIYAKLVTIVAVALVQFVLNKFITFKKTKS